MTEREILEHLQSGFLPIQTESFAVEPETGLVLIDPVKGFASVGAGPLAPAAPNAQVDRMISECDRLSHLFLERQFPVFAFLDTHERGKAEPPYPPHCEIGSGEEEFVDQLAWLEDENAVVKLRKDCINGFVGAIGEDGENAFVDWVVRNGLQRILVLGICTDICVMDFVLTVLSARNHGLLNPLDKVLVYTDGCATYDLTQATARSAGLPATATHPQSITHHIGLYCMASRGATLVSKVS